jgi:hypothetical protein
LALSEDGNKLVATYENYIYTSTNSRTSWAMTSAPSNPWQSVASSADGGRLLAAALGYNAGFIYLSTNSGAAWTQTTAPGLGWAAVAISADGAKLAAAPYFGTLYVSSDAGASFTSGGPTNSWSSVASSADGTRLVAASPDSYGGDGLIYVSTNSGATWTPTSAPSNSWASVASSGDGTQLVAVATDDLGQSLMYISRDSGASWSATTAPPEFGWGTLTSSAAGSNIVALSTLGIADLLQWPLPPPPPPPSPLLSNAQSGANPFLSWLVPSTGFLLQQSADLSSGSWVNVTNQPTFNFTNLHNEVTLSFSPGNAFYRLKRQ